MLLTQAETGILLDFDSQSRSKTLFSENLRYISIAKVVYLKVYISERKTVDTDICPNR